eukprot:SAG31_NODE_2589_length_5427_cov_3.886449_4_plen_81_part_00
MQRADELAGDVKTVRQCIIVDGSFCLKVAWKRFVDCTSSTCANDTQFVETLMGVPKAITLCYTVCSPIQKCNNAHNTVSW